nr:unnamed protein product [Callosobruchus chinensis]
MSDEEKTANLRTHCTEPDDYSTLFETALESVTSKALDEFTEARSQFIQSQMTLNSDSGNEENLYDTALEVANSESASKDVETMNYDSGLPSVSDKFSHKFEETQDVTKDESDDVKLSQNKNILKHAYVEQKSTSSSRVTELVRRLEYSNSRDSKMSDEVIDSQNEDEEFNSSSYDNNTGRGVVDSNSKDLGTCEKVTDNKIGQKLGTSSNNYIKTTTELDDSNSKRLGIVEGDADTKIGQEVYTSSYIFTGTGELDHSNSKDLGIGEEMTDTKIDQEVYTSSYNFSKTCELDQSNSKDLGIGEEDADSRIKREERTGITEQPNSSNDKDLGISSEIIDGKHEVITSSKELTKDSRDIVETIDLTQDPEDRTDNSAFNRSEASESVIEISSSDVIVIDDSVADESTVEQSKVVETSCAGDQVPEKKTEEYYPTELNPFGDEDEENRGTVLTSVPPKEIKPTPVRRLKKILADEEDKILWTPEKQYPKRVSNNPFEEDEDFDEPPKPVRRKKIPTPRISLNPFESEPDESETIEEREVPLPAPRSLEYPSGTPEAKPRSAHHCGTLSPSSRSGFGSNSSISSGSAYGSARSKKPAPRPPIPSFRLDESPGSSLTSSPSHSVHHSPRSTPKYRKSRKAPPPPPITAASSTPSKDEEFAHSDSVGRKLFTNKISLSPIINETGEEANYDNDDFEKEKLVKDEANRTRQGQESNSQPVSLPDKSTTGKWKRRKGQAPSRPVIVRRTVRCLPMAEIKKELELIETQQQGLERQGVRIEKIIRQKCEGSEEGNPDADLPIEVEDLILQLFELVNEKNELFRKQTELMYLRRQQRLEEEHAEIEYQLRCLLHQPEANKTDSDKAREEQLLQRLIEVVEKRNDIVECLESDRIREVREDSSINDHINLYTTKRDEKSESEKSTKEKEKKKLKKLKKLKLFKSDTVKHLDEDESSADVSQKKNATLKKEKKKFTLF